MKKIKLTMVEKIHLFLWLYRSDEYFLVIEHDDMKFKLTDDQGWVRI